MMNLMSAGSSSSRAAAADDDESSAVIEKEHMFQKVVTPSDVGKLNRLVIPKQHAEKHFPLDPSSNEKGLLLNFEDRNGKPWRFRYSYWNSSQSYVMTKGWSRFVKDKRLDAGDMVLFQRGVGDSAKDRLFIDWRRRPDPQLITTHHHYSQFPYNNYHQNSMPPWSNTSSPSLFLQQPVMMRSLDYNQYPNYYASYNNYNVVNGNPCPIPTSSSSSSIMYMRPAIFEASGGGGGVFGGPPVAAAQRRVFDSVPMVVEGKVAARRLRLFGVNMDCPVQQQQDEDSNNNSSSSIPYLQLTPYNASTHDDDDYDDDDKAKATSMSLDLDI